MRKKLLFLALALLAGMMATSSPKASALTCGPLQHIYYCGEDAYCCPRSQWPHCICP